MRKQTLIGQYEGRVNTKNQLAIPKQFRAVLGEEVVVTKGIDGHLIVVSSDRIETLLEGTEGKPFIDRKTREMQRFLFGNAASATLDSQGRFVLPEHLRQYAKITQDVIFAGIKRFVEIWDKESWQKQQAYLSEHMPSIAEQLTQESNG